MHSIFQNCPSEYTLPLWEESLTKRKAGSSLQVIPLLNNLQFRDNRPGILSRPGVIRAHKGWLTLRALLLYSHEAQLHLQLFSQVVSVVPEHGSLKRSPTSPLCPALAALRCRQLRRKNAFPRHWAAIKKTRHCCCGTSAELAWLPAICVRSKRLQRQTFTNWYCQLSKFQAKINRKGRP